MYCCMTDLNVTPKFKYSTLLFKVRWIFSIYRPTISFNEIHEPVQGWNPTTAIKINDQLTRFDDLQKYNEKNNK